MIDDDENGFDSGSGGSDDDDSEGKAGEEGVEAEEGSSTVLSAEERQKFLRQRSRRGGKHRKGATVSASASDAANEPIEAGKKPRGKQMRVWHDGTGKMSAKAMANLDRSNSSRDAGEINLAEVKATYLPDEGEVMNTCCALNRARCSDKRCGCGECVAVDSAMERGR